MESAIVQKGLKGLNKGMLFDVNNKKDAEGFIDRLACDINSARSKTRKKKQTKSIQPSVKFAEQEKKKIEPKITDKNYVHDTKMQI